MGGPFGIRRPLRFLSHKLELDRDQTATLAEILEDLKTERAQAKVDARRAQKLYAEAIRGEAFDAERVAEASRTRVAARQRVEDALKQALSELHALLDEAQREQLAFLLRTGALEL